MNNRLRLAVFLVIGMGIGGCVNLREAIRGVAGVSTKVLEEGKPAAVSGVWKESPAATMAKIERILSDSGAYVYARDAGKHLVAVYVSSTDTTPVGIFWEPAADGATQILVSSPSRFAKERILSTVFKGLETPRLSAGQAAQPETDQAQQR